MPVVTVSRQIGSGGDLIAAKVAQVLRYHHMDKHLVKEVADAASVSEFEVEQFDEKGENFIRHLLRRWMSPRITEIIPSSRTPRSPSEVTFDLPYFHEDELMEDVTYLDWEMYLHFVQFIIQDLADRGNVVIAGRGSQILLADREDALHVRIIASLESRCRRIMEQRNLDEERALKATSRHDKWRKRYIKNYYRVDWNDPQFYHMVINTDQLEIDSAVDLIVQTVRNLSGEDESRNLVA